MTEATVYLGLGSNLGDRLAALAGGVAELERQGAVSYTHLTLPTN